MDAVGADGDFQGDFAGKDAAGTSGDFSGAPTVSNRSTAEDAKPFWFQEDASCGPEAACRSISIGTARGARATDDVESVPAATLGACFCVLKILNSAVPHPGVLAVAFVPCFSGVDILLS